MEQVGTVIGWIGLIVTAVTGGIAGIRALIRGPKEDKALEADIQQRVTDMANRWLERAEGRLKETELAAAEAIARAEAAEERAKAAEDQNTSLGHRVQELEANLFSALNTISALWPWGLAGGGEPRPVLPSWIYEWLHKQSKNTPDAVDWLPENRPND